MLEKRAPAVEIRLGGIGQGVDPTFYTNSVHRATITLHNPTAWDWVYLVTLGSAAPIAFIGQLWTDTPVAAGATITMSRDLVMLDTPVVSPACNVMVTETTTGEWWLFEFGGITLVEEIIPVAAAEVGLVWD